MTDSKGVTIKKWDKVECVAIKGEKAHIGTIRHFYAEDDIWVETKDGRQIKYNSDQLTILT